jgi:hypothetical protein
LPLFLALAFTSISWAASNDPENEKAIVVKVAKNAVIVLANGSGKLTPGENNLCIVVREPLTGKGIHARDVSIDFAQHVGRILESPLRAQLSQQSIGRYCGQVDLGPEYYKPMSFHVEVRYVDADNRKQRVGLCVTAS